MFDYDNTYLINSAFYDNRVALYFSSEVVDQAIDKACWTVYVNGQAATITSVETDPEIKKIDSSSSPGDWVLWHNGIKIFLENSTKTSDTIKVTYQHREDETCGVKFLTSSLGRGGDLAIDIDNVWSTSVVQNPYYGYGEIADVDVSTGKIEGVGTGRPGYFESQNAYVDTPFFENGDPLPCCQYDGPDAKGKYVLESAFIPKYLCQVYVGDTELTCKEHVFPLLVPPAFTHSRLGDAIKVKYWMGATVDVIFFNLIQNFFTEATNLSVFLDTESSAEKGGSAADMIVGSDTSTKVTTSGGNDHITSDRRPLSSVGAADNVSSGAGNDEIYAGAGDDKVNSGTGDDEIYGGAGSDFIQAGTGSDQVEGGPGSDQISAGKGSDAVMPGPGMDYTDLGADKNTDRIIFATTEDTSVGLGRDQVKNFKSGIDKLDLSRIDADVNIDGRQTFGFSWKNASPHSVWYSLDGKNLIVRGDVSGDMTPDFEIYMFKLDVIYESDFVL